MNKKGNIFLFSSFLVTAVLTAFFFIMVIFISETNSLLYNIKLDMYAINKSAVMSVNKGITSRERFSYDKKTYQKYFEKMLKVNYQLEDDMSNVNALVQRVRVLEYEIYEKGDKDDYTKIKVKDTTIHSVIEVKIRPIFLENVLADLFTFKIHEDVVLNVVRN